MVRAILIALLLATACQAAAIRGPQQVAPGSLVVLHVDLSPAAGVVWDATQPEDLETREYAVTGGSDLVFASGCQAVTIVVNALILEMVDGRLSVQKLRHRILVGPPPPPPAVNPYPPPSQKLQAAVGEIRSLKLARADATTLAALYARAASAPPTTTGDLRGYLAAEGSKLGLRGKYPPLAAAVETYLQATLGLDVRPLQPTDAEALQALSWAVWETGD